MARILVIDDDGMMRVLLREMLEQDGHEVVEAADGREGMQIFHQASADLVITDLFLPPKGGLAVIQQLRNEDPDVKVIAISGAGVSNPDVRYDLETLSLAKRRGAFRAFKKPFKRDEMLKAVHELLA